MDNLNLSGKDLWQAAVNELAKTYPRQASYCAEVVFIYEDERTLYLGMPHYQARAKEGLERLRIRGVLCGILSRLAGRSLVAHFQFLTMPPSISQDSNDSSDVCHKLAATGDTLTIRDHYMLALLPIIITTNHADVLVDQLVWASEVVDAAMKLRKEGRP